MLTAITYTLAAALLNRWRGGGWPYLPTEIHGGANDRKRTQVRRIVFAIGLGLLAWNPLVAVIMFVSCLTGWGFPVSAAIGARKPTDYEPEFGAFDWLSKSLIGQYSARTYGIVWLTLHGLAVGAMLSMATQSLWPLLGGVMGITYGLTRDWELGEYAHGAALGLALYLTL